MTLPDPQELLEAFSLALDLSGKRNLEHALRTCYLSLGLSSVLGHGPRDRELIYYRSLLHDIGSLHPTLRTPPRMNIGGKIVDPEDSDLEWDVGGPSDGSRLEDSSLEGLLPGSSEPCPWERIISFADQVEIRMSEGMEDRREIVRTSKKWPVCLEDFRIWEAFRELSENEGFWIVMRRKSLSDILRKERPASLSISGEKYGTFIHALSDLIDSKSYFTARHSGRVSDMARRISISMGLSENAVEEVALAGLFHDLGKLAVPLEILDKPAKLNPDEYEVIKLHPHHTQSILEKITGFSRVAALAGAHHERIDGKGYHRRLRGNQLSTGARILAVTDAFDALTHIRPYRHGMPPDKALQLIEHEEKNHFDPDVIHTLGKIALG